MPVCARLGRRLTRPPSPLLEARARARALHLAPRSASVSTRGSGPDLGSGGQHDMGGVNQLSRAYLRKAVLPILCSQSATLSSVALSVAALQPITARHRGHVTRCDQ